MKAMPTIPSPTTTSRVLPDEGGNTPLVSGAAASMVNECFQIASKISHKHSEGAQRVNPLAAAGNT